jgi:hypothetical protein
MRPSQPSSEQESLLGSIPLHFRLNSFSSPADTPRLQAALKPLQATESNINASVSQGTQVAASLSNELLSRLSHVLASPSPKALLPKSIETNQMVHENGNDVSK